ncbi:tyramine beta hydroxylase [Apis mellifera]|uniref:Tyramine beta hydroxylase n=1 Tax=Apis mellifera TaxID=7460 RepID=A0A8U0WQC8_APIME|nr:tyramine beta hydroxylase [Apis mellifera]DAA05780.1 TPA_exp: tyramine beta hydroxylase [Apis mellifera]|eukprot:NP_001071292.1 tyramine beta hydroxylase [Apis mellifera]
MPLPLLDHNIMVPCTRINARIGGKAVLYEVFVLSDLKALVEIGDKKAKDHELLKDGSCLFWHNHHQNREDNSERKDVHTIPLSSDITFYWRVDFMSEIIIAEVHYTSIDNTWFAIGFSEYGKLKSADYCVLWIDWHRQIQLQDAWADEEGKLNLDLQQDCENFAWRRRGNITKFTFSRKFDTCDENDYIMERGTTHLVWLKGLGPLSSLTGLQVSDAETAGMSRTELIRTLHKKPIFPSNAWQLEILTDRVKVPNKETTYWCRVQKLPPILSQKHHILQFGPVIQTGNEHLVHHMEVFHCAGPINFEIPMYDGPCDGADRPEKTQICKKVLAAWAMGADAFVYPEEAGLSIGGQDFNPYIMLEIHYNNPEFQNGNIDSSGIRLEYTDKMAIPPQQEAFTLSGHCIQECTGIGLPQYGIHIFASQLHTHLTGIKVITRHIRDGEELPLLNYDNHYSTHFQEIRLLPKPVIILPGDSLITTCTYNTMDRENITLGGFAISDEMCVNYIHYYPNTRLEVCKSAISNDALRTYFRYMREWENQPISIDNGISSNYKSIEWTKVRVQALHDLYEAAPLGMQCNGSDGSRLPGLWDNIAASPVKLPLPPPARNCPEIRH